MSSPGINLRLDFTSYESCLVYEQWSLDMEQNGSGELTTGHL